MIAITSSENFQGPQVIIDLGREVKDHSSCSPCSGSSDKERDPEKTKTVYPTCTIRDKKELLGLPLSTRMTISIEVEVTEQDAGSKGEYCDGKPETTISLISMSIPQSLQKKKKKLDLSRSQGGMDIIDAIFEQGVELE